MSNEKKTDSNIIEVNPPKSLDSSFSVFIREDEIVTGEDTVFTLKFKTQEKLREYFIAENLTKHEFFIRTDSKKLPKTPVIVRIVHPDTGKIIVIYAVITREGAHPKKSGIIMGLYYKIQYLDKAQAQIIRDFAA